MEVVGVLEGLQFANIDFIRLAVTIVVARQGYFPLAQIERAAGVRVVVKAGCRDRRNSCDCKNTCQWIAKATEMWREGQRISGDVTVVLSRCEECRELKTETLDGHWADTIAPTAEHPTSARGKVMHNETLAKIDALPREKVEVLLKVLFAVLGEELRYCGICEGPLGFRKGAHYECWAAESDGWDTLHVEGK